jgi:hypothetical protein
VEPLKTLIALALASTVTPVHAAAPKVAIFDFEFVDTSIDGATNGPRGDEGARLAWLDREMRRRLAQSGRADVVDVAGVVDRTRAKDLRTCGGCDAKFASMRGNTDEWWSRALDWLVDRYLLAPDAGVF